MDRMPAADNDDVPTLDRLRTVQANLRAAFPNSLVGQRRALEKAEQEVRELLEAAGHALRTLDTGDANPAMDPELAEVLDGLEDAIIKVRGPLGNAE